MTQAMQTKNEQIRREPVPQCLKNLFDPPCQLYVSGQSLASILRRPRLAVVGSRRVSAYGSQVTSQLVRVVAARGVVIISGLAYGVDGLAHQAALDAGGTTVAVMAGGLDSIYPHRHRALARQIRYEQGSLVSEYPVGKPPLPHQFIARNRLIAGLADAVLLTEAAIKSGSLHTADFAQQLGKDVLAVPGNITAASSAGTNRLLQDGAIPIYSADDLLAYFSLSAAEAEPTPTTDPIVQLLQQGISSTDALQRHSGLDAASLAHRLTMLELTGRIVPAGPGQWRLQ